MKNVRLHIVIEVSFHDLSISDMRPQAQLSFQNSQSRDLFFLKVYFSFTLISSFLHFRHYIILMKNDAFAIDDQRNKVGGLSVHSCAIIIGILKIVPSRS